MTSNEWLQIFATNLKKIMNMRHCSQRELSNLTGLAESNISRYLSCQQIPKSSTLIDISNALGCTVDDLTKVKL